MHLYSASEASGTSTGFLMFVDNIYISQQRGEDRTTAGRSVAGIPSLDFPGRLKMI